MVEYAIMLAFIAAVCITAVATRRRENQSAVRLRQRCVARRMSAALWCVCTASFLAAVSDLRTRRIPDALAGALFLCGLILNASAGWQTAAAGLAIVVAVLVAGTVAFSLKLVGGGDVKLVAAAAGDVGLSGRAPSSYSSRCWRAER